MGLFYCSNHADIHLRMAIASSAAIKKFQGTRSRLVRESDQKEFYGWVVETGTELIIAIDGEKPAENERLEVFLGSKAGSCSFITTIGRTDGNRCAFAWPELIRIGEPNHEARRKSERVSGKIETPVEVMDLAPNGMGLLTDFRLETGANIDLRLTTDFGELCLTATVVYCRPEDNLFRVGVKLQELSRLNQARWDQVLAA